MGILSLLKAATGDNKGSTSTLGLQFEEYYMDVDTQANQIVLMKVGSAEDAIKVDRDKVCIRTNKISECFVMGRLDYFTKGGTCTLASIDANGVHYIINDTWIPDEDVCVADRILRSGRLTPSMVNKAAYVKRSDSGYVEVLTNDGEYISIAYDKFVNSYNTDFISGIWFQAHIAWCNGIDQPACIMSNGVIAPTLKNYIDSLGRDLGDTDKSYSLDDGTVAGYKMTNHNTELWLKKRNDITTHVPADKVLIKRSTWEEFFLYEQGDYIEQNSPCEYIGEISNGYHVIVNDTWDPGHNAIVANRIQRKSIMTPEYNSANVFVVHHVDNGISLINENGEYAERPYGTYSMTEDTPMMNGVWYSGTMDWHENDIPLITVHKGDIAPSLGAYIRSKGYEM